ncbi:MAG TPA: hypothetical protein RMH85_24145 [Polyangiaceae bacterium LLY-WYZ-15_(1-7)]|nr:hypothetical protein [Polyangiaceae bacterium LLY-WYZ-15_(1-7)]HJL05935.1 hypothetical protein [Polyangiaceae bacterium LLY-WYZ-15_(1-7)]HJL11589.1 hypothetical protein [Polyangiaceae bacterium LLY-WYZ-15_(1-7)]HJL38735.1 hypothetical protein [Polyangiaceae bacterium LLY-WYZ-15_(1-7)]HJL46335.1 hypothetical protein [Polyangiaceae bacterium LLY-WYZ-15_(1-7)]
MNQDEIVHALETPVPRFPTKAVALATEDRDLAVGAARAVLVHSVEIAEAGALPRPQEGDLGGIDPAESFGAIHACFLVRWHDATEAEPELARIAQLSETQLEAVFGDYMHECLPHAFVALPPATLSGWLDDAKSPSVKSALATALAIHALQGRHDRHALRERLRAELDATRERFASLEGQAHEQALLELGYLAYPLLAVSLRDEVDELRALYDAGPLAEALQGILHASDFERLPTEEADLGEWAELTPLAKTDPRAVATHLVYGWLPPKKKADAPASKSGKLKKKKPKKKKKKR